MHMQYALHMRSMHMPMPMPMPMLMPIFRGKYSSQKLSDIYQGKIFFTENFQGKYSLHKTMFLFIFKLFNMQRRHLKKIHYFFFIKKYLIFIKKSFFNLFNMQRRHY